MELLASLGLGFSVALQPYNLMFCFVGVVVGTLVGVLPGIGPVGAMSILLTTALRLPPETAIIMLAGIYYGAQYGGSTTAVLVNIPGEASSIVTCLDGYQMAQRGRAGAALGIAAFASFLAGTVALIGLVLLAPPLIRFALAFGPPEYFALMALGLTLLVYLAAGSVPKALMMAAAGLVLGLIGLDAINGMERFTFGRMELMEGLDIAPVVMGLFGVGEILTSLESKDVRQIVSTKIRNLLPSGADWARSAWPITRGSVLGFFLGILPGGGTIVASLLSYGLEKRVSRHPEEFGHGAIEGVAGPEAANNAAAGGAFIPLLTLGVPANVVMAILMGALLAHGVTPGPLLPRQNPQIFWGVVASMYVGNVMLLVLNLPLIGVWVQALKVPRRILFPIVLFLCLLGAYSVKNSAFDMGVVVVFGVLGYVLRKFGYEPAPLVLAFVLGPMFENALRQSLLLSQGRFNIFVTRPIAATALGLAVLLLALSALPSLRKWRGSAVLDQI
jgi:putative tricarboxylic transport membrane protein